MAVPPWDVIENEGQRATWAADSSGVVPVYWLYGLSARPIRTAADYAQRLFKRFAPAGMFPCCVRWIGSILSGLPVRLVGDKLHTYVPETYHSINTKTVAGLRYILATQDFDYILRTNSSTYVNLEMLEEFAQRLPASSYYGGLIGKSDGVSFASGTCALMSRDVASAIASDPDWEYELMDDVAIGRSVFRSGIKVRPINRIDILKQDDLKRLTAKGLSSTFVVRCKSDGDRAHDVIAMHQVHSKVLELREKHHRASLGTTLRANRRWRSRIRWHADAHTGECQP